MVPVGSYSIPGLKKNVVNHPSAHAKASASLIRTTPQIRPPSRPKRPKILFFVIFGSKYHSPSTSDSCTTPEEKVGKKDFLQISHKKVVWGGLFRGAHLAPSPTKKSHTMVYEKLLFCTFRTRGHFRVHSDVWQKIFKTVLFHFLLHFSTSQKSQKNKG